MLCILHINSIGIRVLYLITDCPAFIFYKTGIMLIKKVLSFSVLIIFRGYKFLFNKYLFLGLNKSTMLLIKYILFSYPHFIHSKDQEV